MATRTTKFAAKALGVTTTTLLKYVKDPAFPKPRAIWRGKQKQYAWSDKLIDQYRRILEAARSQP